MIAPVILKEILPVFQKQLESFERNKTMNGKNYNGRSTIAEYDGKKFTIEDYDNIVKSAIKTWKTDTLIEHCNKLEKVGCVNPPSGMTLDYEFTFESWLEFLNRNGSNWAKEQLCNKYKIQKDYDMVSWVYECFLKGKEERGEYVDPVLYYQTGYYKYKQIDDDLAPDEVMKRYEGKIISVGQWYKKAIDAGFNINDIDEGKWCIDHCNWWEKQTDKRGRIKIMV